MDKKRTTCDEYFIFCAWAFYAFSSFSGIALGERWAGRRETCWECRVSRIRDWGWPPLRFPFFVGPYYKPRWFEMKIRGIYIRRLGLYVAAFISRRELVRRFFYTLDARESFS